MFLSTTTAVDVSEQSTFNQFISATVRFAVAVYRSIFVHFKTA